WATHAPCCSAARRRWSPASSPRSPPRCRRGAPTSPAISRPARARARSNGHALASRCWCCRARSASCCSSARGCSCAACATCGTCILRGRGVAAQDGAHAPGVMVVSDAMAKTLWPGRDPIGQCVQVGADLGRHRGGADTAPCRYVVGVAENIRSQKLGNDPGLFYYLSAAQWHPQDGGLFTRTRGEATPQVETIR